jgi:hypothetical protein
VDAFSSADVDYAEAFAALLAVAPAAARIIDGLDQAVVSHGSIAVAVGIVRERHSVDQARAWAILTRLSSHSNRKPRDIAAEVVEGKPLTYASRSES